MSNTPLPSRKGKKQPPVPPKTEEPVKNENKKVIVMDDSLGEMEKQHKNKVFGKMRKLIEELIQTEEDYVGHLSKLNKEFIHELREKKIISTQLHMTLFNSVKMITPINLHFLFRIKTKLNDPEEFYKSVTQFSACFKLYSDYVIKYSATLDLIKKEKSKNKKFVKFLNAKEDYLKKSGYRIPTLQSFLILPVQRLPRYKLFFDGLLKESGKVINKTEEEKKEEEILQQAYKTVLEITKHIDKGKEVKDKLNEINMLEQYARIKEFVKSYRKVIHVWREVKFKNNSLQERKVKVYRECNVYLLTDLIIVTGFDREVEKKKKIVYFRTYAACIKEMKYADSTPSLIPKEDHDKCLEMSTEKDLNFIMEIVFDSKSDRDLFKDLLAKQLEFTEKNPQYTADWVRRNPSKRRERRGSLFAKKEKQLDGVWRHWERIDHVPPLLIKPSARNVKEIQAYHEIPEKMRKKKIPKEFEKKFWK